MASNDSTRRKAVIGNTKGSSWLYDSKTGFDLSYPDPASTSTSTSTLPGNAITIQTTKESITIDPAKSALVIIDMQNFFLSADFGRSADSNGLKAQENLIQYAIPAARRAGIRIIWMNWGLTDEELETMPPATIRSFGFKSVAATKDDSKSEPQLETMGKNKNFYIGLGNEFEPITSKTGATINPGRMLMRDQWNTALTPELELLYKEGLEQTPPDVWIHKNRLSGFWDSTTQGIRYLVSEGIKTLFFAGVNTDQCVWGSWIDAYFRGYDCVLLSDGCATSSPEFASRCAEFNAENFGFVCDCRTFSRCVDSARVG